MESKKQKVGFATEEVARAAPRRGQMEFQKSADQPIDGRSTLGSGRGKMLARGKKFGSFAVLAIALLIVPVDVGARVPILDPERGVMTMAPLLEKTTPAVVNISVKVRAPGQQNPLMRDPFFRRFFDLPQHTPEQNAMSAGSGVIVDAEKGYVMTNHHVIDKADDITVTLKDRRSFKAKLIGSDPETDIALLQIRPDSLKALPLGDSDQLRVGDLVFAIGNPFGLGQTVTNGIVSALGRGIGMHGYEDFIQTDASINPGNSGGALVSSKGELIGINTAIIGPAGGNVGIGFAVPANMAQAVMDQLIRYGEVRRGRLGVVIQDLTPDIAAAFGLSQNSGAIVTKVEPKSPADAAGMKPGDVIVSVNGRAIRSSGDLRNRVGLTQLGTAVRLEYYRDRKRRVAEVRIAAPQPSVVKGEETIPQLSGATFRDMTPAEVAERRTQGVLVARVESGSPAWRYGVRSGDVVRAVNREEVTSVHDFQRVMKSASEAFWISMVRNGEPFLVVIG